VIVLIARDGMASGQSVHACPWIASRRGPAAAFVPPVDSRHDWLQWAATAPDSPCQAQGRRFDPDHPLQ